MEVRGSRYTDEVVQLWLAELHKDGLSHGTILTHLSALRHYAHSRNKRCTLTAPRTLLLLKGIKKSSRSQPATRPAVTLDHLRRIKDAAERILDKWESCCFIAMTLTAFFGLLRPSEYCITNSQHHLHWQDIKMENRRRSFTANLRSFKHSTRAHQIVIRRFPDTEICPVRAMTRYRKTTSMPKHSAPLFEITATEYRWLFRDVIKEANIYTNLTPHSLRHGGATWAAKQGWSEARLCAHGRWSSNAFRTYLHAV